MKSMRNRWRWSLRLALLLAPALPQWAVVAAAPDRSGEEFFEEEVRPLLAERCVRCHGDGASKAGLKLTSRASLLAGGESGPAAVAGQPDESLLIEAVGYQGLPQMPPKGKLSEGEIATLTRWVAMGLPWPDARPEAPTGAVAAPPRPITEEQRRFWSFRPVEAVEPPAVKDTAWPRSRIDHFILSALEARGLAPAPPADRRTLIRRATFDLTGLPPTPDEVEAFLEDGTPDAFARVVDRLLASPHYGERWARHWLDVVRYADSSDARAIGSVMDITEAWRYRDWVVDAFNRDLPYDQFVRDQVAGDLQPPDAPDEAHAAGIIATGLLAIGNWGGGDADKEKLLTDIADDQVDVVGRAFLGLTIACARCHDHKFDPIPTADYYGLAGIFFSTHILPDVGPKTNGPPMLKIPLISRAQREASEQYAARLGEREQALKAATEEQYRSLARALRPQTARYMVAAWDYRNRPPDQADLSPGDFAAPRGLHAFALRQWIDFLGLADYTPMTLPVRDVLGAQGVHAWKGPNDTPSLTANTTPREIRLLTFRLPPRSISVHPGPANGVVVGWRSPIAGMVRITGRLTDADPAGGDGVAWILDHRSAAGLRELASGDVPNGGSQALDRGKDGDGLSSVEVQPGDWLQLLVLPKSSHTCDTTTLELVISDGAGTSTWDLARDVLDDPLDGNPHADRLGHAAVWRFDDMGQTTRATPPAAGSPLAEWGRAIAVGPARDAIERAAERFQATFTLEDPRSPFWIRSPADESALPPEARRTLAELRNERDALKAHPPPPVAYAVGAQEGGVPGSPQAGVHDVRVHLRGRYDRLGAPVPRHFPTVLAGEDQAPIAAGSGRRELGQWLTRPDHPLTARVMVNRIWQHHFGEGIVRTPGNFGRLGERPTHPELLDDLARLFVAGGWSIKRMHRAILLSATYRQSGATSAESLRQDPENRLFGRMGRRRLEAEAIRDSLLAVAGRLDPTRGGPAYRDFATPRRTLYLMAVRSDRSGFGPLFDAADPTAMVDRRTASTVAPQALFLLNHPFVLDGARSLARRLLGEIRGDDPARIRRAYERLYARPPTDEEVEIGLTTLAGARQAGESTEAAWEAYCQVLLCANEFLYVD
jgi:hypothetical protein